MTRTALITGSNRGIGLAVARTLLAKGLDVVLTARRGADAQAAAASLAPRGTAQVRAEELDLAKEASVAAAATRLGRQGVAVDVLVNNGGVLFEGDVLTTAHNRLRNAGYSQLPVMRGEELVGFIAEDDILRHAFGRPERFNDPVSAAMHTNFLVVEPTLSLHNLVAMLDVQPYAAVMDADGFHGLITRADVLNYLRRQMAGAPAS